MQKILPMIMLILLSQIGWAQEICNNGLDDDGDGWIDEADPDCDSGQKPAAYDQVIEVCEFATGRGIGFFNLTDLNSIIDGGAGNIVTWYEDAALISPIAFDSTNVSVSDGEVFYAKVADSLNYSVATASFTVNAKEDASFSYLQSDFCQNEANPLPAITTFGGIFSANAGLLLDTATGEIDLSASSPGTYTVTYTTSGSCADTDSFIVAIRDASPYFHTLAATNISCAGVKINWELAPNASEYEIQISEEYNLSNLVVNQTTVENSLDVTDLTLETTYYYRIGAMTDCGISFSEKDSITLYGSPAVPYNLSTSNINTNGFDLQWQLISEADTYLVEVSEEYTFSQLTKEAIIGDNLIYIDALQPNRTYYCRVKAMNGCGESATSSIKATTLDNGSLVQDSLALIAFYHATDGDDWTKNDNWLTGPVNTWYGVTKYKGRISAIQLYSNNIKGSIPNEFNKLSKLSSLQLSNNYIHSLPDSFQYKNPYLSGWIDGNNLTFKDFLEQSFGCKYGIQNKIGLDTILYTEEGKSLTINLGIDEDVADNQYIWFKDSIAIDTTNINSYALAKLTLDDSGVYTCEVTNPRDRFLTLYSYEYKLIIEDKNRTVSSQDSLALVALYHATNGDNWKRNDNWLTGPVNTWYGVSLTNKRIGKLFLNYNNLHGEIPKEIGALNNLSEAFLDHNRLEGKIPKEIGNLKLYNLTLEYNQLVGDVPLEVIEVFANNGTEYDSLGIAGNNLSGLPSYPNMIDRFSHDIKDNRLTFEDIIPNIGYLDEYAPQALIGQDTTLYFTEGQSYKINLDIDKNVPDNQYIWFKDDVAIDTTNSNSYALANVSISDEGIYTCEVTNPRAPALTLYSKPMTIHVIPKFQNPEMAVESACTGNSVTFSVTGRYAEDTYFWEIIPASDTIKRVGLPDSLATAQDFSYDLATTGDFIARVTLSSPYAADTVLQNTFSVFNIPEIILPESVNMEIGVVVLAAVDSKDADNLMFAWTYQDTLALNEQNTIKVTQAGRYQVRVTTATGCQTKAEVLVVVSKREQTITFDALADKVLGNEPLVLNATVSSGLEIRYTATGPVRLDKNVLTLLDTGKVTVTAMQDGDNNYLPAASATQTFRVKAQEDTVTTDSVRFNLTLSLSSLNGMPVPVLTAKLYQKSGKQFVVVATQKITETSSLTFEQVPGGSYTVGLMPENTDFLPAYLGNKMMLSNAKMITLVQDTIQYISLFGKPITRPEGQSFISGILLNDAEAANGRILVNTKKYAGEALSGVAVYLLHPETQEILAYDMTDAEGKFTFTGLDAGSYLFAADYNGLPQDEIQNVIQVNNDAEAVSIVVVAATNVRVTQTKSEQQVTGLDEEMRAVPIQYYPNPVVDELFIDTDRFWLGGRISITDLSGRHIRKENIYATHMKIPVKALSTGVYHLTLTKGKHRQTFKLIKQ